MVTVQFLGERIVKIIELKRFYVFQISKKSHRVLFPNRFHVKSLQPNIYDYRDYMKWLSRLSLQYRLYRYVLCVFCAWKTRVWHLKQYKCIILSFLSIIHWFLIHWWFILSREFAFRCILNRLFRTVLVFFGNK